MTVETGEVLELGMVAVDEAAVLLGLVECVEGAVLVPADVVGTVEGFTVVGCTVEGFAVVGATVVGRAVGTVVCLAVVISVGSVTAAVVG